MKQTPQTDTQSVWEHGQSVQNYMNDLLDHLQKGTPLKYNWKLPKWIYDEILLKNMPDHDTINLYKQQYRELYNFIYKQIGLYYIMRKKWSYEEIDLLKKYYPDKINSEISKLLNRTISSVSSKANKLNLTKNEGIIGNNNKKSDISYLLENNLNSFYWIGFILADGTFINNKQLKISSIDRDHIRRLGNLIKSNIYVYRRKTQYKKNSIIYQISSYDSNLVPLLMERYNIKSKKTYNPPNIENYPIQKNEMLSLIIGFIDGDRCISFTNKKYKRISIQSHLSWKNNLDFINNFLHDYFNVTKDNKVTETNKGYSSIYIGKSKILNGIKLFVIENNINTSKKFSKL